MQTHGLDVIRIEAGFSIHDPRLDNDGWSPVLVSADAEWVDDEWNRPNQSDFDAAKVEADRLLSERIESLYSHFVTFVRLGSTGYVVATLRSLGRDHHDSELARSLERDREQRTSDDDPEPEPGPTYKAVECGQMPGMLWQLAVNDDEPRLAHIGNDGRDTWHGVPA